MVVKDLDFGDEETFVLVGAGEEDYDTGKILVTSPLAQGLMGGKVGQKRRNSGARRHDEIRNSRNSLRRLIRQRPFTNEFTLPFPFTCGRITARSSFSRPK